MKKLKTFSMLLFALFFCSANIFGQFARVQIIHNSPDPTVDIYVNGIRLLDDFKFRQATPFIDVPAGIPLSVAVAPASSMSVSDAIATFPLTLENGRKYVVMAAGVVGGSPGFNLFVNGQAREAASNPTNVDVAVFHGSPDAPAVDVDAVFLADNVVSNLAFGNFTNYLSLPAGKYDLAIQPAGTNSTVASFRADLSGLAGGAATVFASGLLTGTPAFGIFAALPDGTVVQLPATPTARVQIIHNSPSPTVDIYVGNTRLLDDFAFRTATPFIDVPADRDLNIGVAPANSNAASDAIANFPVNLTTGGNFVVMAAGVVGGSPGFNLFVNGQAREAASNPTNVDVAVFHGSPDAPNVDVYEFYSPAKLIDNLAFGKFTDYLSIPAGIYDLKIEQAGSQSSFAPVFRADLRNLGGGAATVFASGFYASGMPVFGLFAALPDGTVVQLPSTPMAEVQVIHNSPDPTVDVYLNGTFKLEDFRFRQSWGFTDVPADRPLRVSIAPSTSNSVSEAIANFDYNLKSNVAYVIVAAGVVGNSGNTAFNLFVKENARTSSGNANNVSIQVFHGSPDAPAVDVILPNGTVLIDNLSFGEFSNYLNVPAETYTLYITPANDNSTIVGAYILSKDQPFPIAGQALTITASGFLNGNPSFGLWAYRSGFSYPLVATTSANEKNSLDAQLSLFPNPASEEILVSLTLPKTQQIRYRMFNLAGKMVMEGDFGKVEAGEFSQLLSLQNLPTGMYQLQILSGEGFASSRVVIQR